MASAVNFRVHDIRPDPANCRGVVGEIFIEKRGPIG